MKMRNDMTAETVHPQGAPASAEGSYPTPNPPSTPINNMGENLGNLESYEAVDVVLTNSGKKKIIMCQKPANDGLCVIDWVNFTVSEQTWWKTFGAILLSEDQHVAEASRVLKKIFGFGVTAKREKGLNHYQASWVLGDDMGFVCFGGQRQTMLVTLTGQGCVHAKEGWQQRLHDFLATDAVRPSISRIDLAHDDFNGAYLSVDWAEQQWALSGYTARAGGRAPNIERVGNWHRPSGAGRTLYIGTRSSGKFCRFYEKGKAEGDALSPWVRCEVEFKSSDRIIPFEILLRPSMYFAGAYRCFATFAQHATPTRLVLKQKTAQIVMDSAIEITRHQFGKYLRVFREIYGDKDTLDAVCNNTERYWPKRLKALGASVATGGRDLYENFKVPSFVMGDEAFLKAVPSHGLLGKSSYTPA